MQAGSGRTVVTARFPHHAVMGLMAELHIRREVRANTCRQRVAAAAAATRRSRRRPTFSAQARSRFGPDAPKQMVDS